MQEHRNDKKTKPAERPVRRSEFVSSARLGALIAAGVMLVAIPPLKMLKSRDAQQEPPVAMAPDASAPAPSAPSIAHPPAPVAPSTGVRLADFRGEDPSADARLVANWVVATGDAKKHAFVVVDKKDARVYVFGRDGRLRDSAPALLGSAHGDDSFPGIGDKPLELVRPEEKTTPAGRFVAEPGLNASHEDVVWVDYDAAVSMHRIRPTVASERRLERLASLTVDDNRISFGCINLPVRFYEDVVSPTVRKEGAVIYVLPDTKTVQQVFGAFDVTDPAQAAAIQARTQQPASRAGVQKVALKP
ncbi:hypothetical protein H8N03_03920 [Ramlibacter sp. USB13]|uniref:L,D-TPase catalytic domain-containing protein n=1 Tax=Ramlibacter cellulosilyticus TaxID=2764187 RepID=A0A923MMZ3_9BURK|nr:hypothetical protein [Ramlibacter cellulosilyticus]MBC5782078.1 hypothetical protein [Ramlibacter cellulosilyticus]